MEKSPEEQKADWGNWIENARKANKMSESGYYALLKAHPAGNPPTSTELIKYRNHLNEFLIESKRGETLAAQTKQAALDRSKADTAKVQQATQKATDAGVHDQLTGAADLDAWNRILSDNGRKVDDFGPPPFDPVTKQVIPDAMKRFDESGMTAKDRAAATAKAATAAEVKARDLVRQGQEERRLKQGDVRNAQGQERIDQSATQLKTTHETMMHGLDNKVLADTAGMLAGQGKTANASDVVAYLKDPERWKDNPEVSANRTELIQRFSKMGKQDLDALNTAARTKRAETGGKGGGLSALAKGQWMKDHPGEPIPAELPIGNVPAPQNVAPKSTTPATPTPAKAPVAAAPKKAPATQKIRATIPGHGLIDFPSQAAFDEFKKDHPEFTWK
jgi:hypothetical protein